MDQNGLIETARSLLEETEMLMDADPLDLSPILASMSERIRNRKELEDALNVEPADPETLAHFIKRHEASGGVIPRDEENLIRKGELASRLRSYVDPWLSAGLNADGSESPGNRKLPEHLPYPLCIQRSPKNWTNNFLDSVDGDLNRLLSLIYQDKRWAWSYLGKCRFASCGLYFIKKPLSRYSRNSPFRSHYKFGTFCCLKHQNNAAALIGTGQMRTAAEDKLIDFAAKSLLNYPADKGGWQKDRRFKVQLAATLADYIHENGLQSYRYGVKENWVNRRLARIEQRRLEFAAKRDG